MFLASIGPLKERSTPSSSPGTAPTSILNSGIGIYSDDSGDLVPDQMTSGKNDSLGPPGIPAGAAVPANHAPRGFRSGHAAVTASPTAMPSETSTNRWPATVQAFSARGTSITIASAMPA